MKSTELDSNSQGENGVDADGASSVPRKKPRFAGGGRAFACFALVESIALVTFARFGGLLWFRFDEWQFLAVRTAWGRDSLLAPHGFVHPQMLPVLAYRLLWWLFGLRTYTPYLLLIIVMHLACAFLLRMVMLRAGARAWPATIVASAFVFFGAGYECIIWPFQIGYVGSLLFGLIHIQLSDHDGHFDKRDALGLIAALAGLACSAIGITMVFAAGVAIVIRRGWKMSLAQTVPLATIFVLWFEFFARERYEFAKGFHFIKPATPMELIRFSTGAFFNTLHAFGNSEALGLALVALLFSGIVLSWRARTSSEIRAQLAVPIGLFAGMIASLLLTGYGRQSHLGAANASRYLYVVAALVVPALGIAASAWVNRSAAVGAVALAVIIVGMPGDLHHMVAYVHKQEPTEATFKAMMLTLPRVPLARVLPDTERPITGFLSIPGYVTAGWLARGVESGRIPAPRRENPGSRANATLRWAIRDDGPCFECGPAGRVPSDFKCRPLAATTTFRIPDRAKLLVVGSVVLRPIIGRLDVPYPLTITSAKRPERLSARADIAFRAFSPSRTATICT
ncbi:MAG: hypothetical protein QOG50_2927 [Actinomycetota bacterium]|nr:hypothetical protein [Actinomycetota bacterium]